MSLPTFLVLEVRAAFRSSARHHVATQRYPYSTTARLLARNSPVAKKSNSSIRSQRKDGPSQSASKLPKYVIPSALPTSETTSTAKTTELLPSRPRRTSLDTNSSTVTIPAKILPKAELAPNVHLSPMQRLHIEHMTRHPPPSALANRATATTKTYKEVLPVYNLGLLSINAMTISRVLAIGLVSFMTAVWIPAYYLSSTVPVWSLVFIWASSLVPLLALNHFTRSMITEMFLVLPPTARVSPAAAMNYARNLPRDAVLHIRFLRWTGIPGFMRVRIADVQPLPFAAQADKPWWLPRDLERMANFKIPMTPMIKETSSFLKPAITEFFVRTKTAGGRAARNTIPGLWEIVYKRLTGVEVGAVPRWKA